MSEVTHYMEAASRLRDERDAALARLDAAEEALVRADALADRVDRIDVVAYDLGRLNELVAYRDARAALARLPAAGEEPPQVDEVYEAALGGDEDAQQEVDHR